MLASRTSIQSSRRSRGTRATARRLAAVVWETESPPPFFLVEDFSFGGLPVTFAGLSTPHLCAMHMGTPREIDEMLQKGKFANLQQFDPILYNIYTAGKLSADHVAAMRPPCRHGGNQAHADAVRAFPSPRTTRGTPTRQSPASVSVSVHPRQRGEPRWRRAEEPHGSMHACSLPSMRPRAASACTVSLPPEIVKRFRLTPCPIMHDNCT